MKIWKNTVLFYLGGTAYMTLEFLWRGFSHYTMFLLGGLCFLMLGKLRSLRLPLPVLVVLGAGGVTVLELATGLLVNRAYTVWDYRHMPMNFLGQICLPFTLLWMPVCLAGMELYHAAESLVKKNQAAV